jgi:Zn ribbon nucleic-acid-binding protein
MSIPLTQICPQCDSDMELLTADDDGEIVLYECPDCGFQSEHRIDADERDRDEREQERDAGAEDAALEGSPEDEGEEDDARSPDIEEES